MKWVLYQFSFRSDERYLTIKSRLVLMAARLGFYERDILRQLDRVVPHGGTAVDVGANCGVYTKALLKCVGSSGQVHALEPNPVYSTLLKQCGKDHSGFRYHGIAAGATEHNQRLHIPRLAIGAPEPALASVVERSSHGTDIDVRVVPLDTLLASLDRLDLIKIDVEGLELDVLSGARALLHRFHPVLIIETLDLSALDALLRALKTGYRRTYPSPTPPLDSSQSPDCTYVFEWYGD